MATEPWSLLIEDWFDKPLVIRRKNIKLNMMNGVALSPLTTLLFFYNSVEMPPENICLTWQEPSNEKGGVPFADCRE